MKPLPVEWEVLVGNVGFAYRGPDKAEAEKEFRTWIANSRSKVGRCADEPVTLLKDGEVVAEYLPPRTLRKGADVVGEVPATLRMHESSGAVPHQPNQPNHMKTQETIDFLTAFAPTHREWSTRNFGPPTEENRIDPALGVIEELGELAHALLKKKQGIRGTAQEHDEAIKDALADSFIYATDLLGRTRTDFHDHEFALGFDDLPNLMDYHGLDSVEAKTLCDISSASGNVYWLVRSCGQPDMIDTPFKRARMAGMLFRLLHSMAERFDVDLLRTVQETWDSIVSQRNWRTNPDNGSNSAE